MYAIGVPGVPGFIENKVVLTCCNFVPSSQKTYLGDVSGGIANTSLSKKIISIFLKFLFVCVFIKDLVKIGIFGIWAGNFYFEKRDIILSHIHTHTHTKSCPIALKIKTGVKHNLFSHLRKSQLK